MTAARARQDRFAGLGEAVSTMRSLTLTQTRWLPDQVRDMFRICGSLTLTLSGMTDRKLNVLS